MSIPNERHGSPEDAPPAYEEATSPNPHTTLNQRNPPELSIANLDLYGSIYAGQDYSFASFLVPSDFSHPLASPRDGPIFNGRNDLRRVYGPVDQEFFYQLTGGRRLVGDEPDSARRQVGEDTDRSRTTEDERQKRQKRQERRKRRNDPSTPKEEIITMDVEYIMELIKERWPKEEKKEVRYRRETALLNEIRAKRPELVTALEKEFKRAPSTGAKPSKPTARKPSKPTAKQPGFPSWEQSRRLLFKKPEKPDDLWCMVHSHKYVYLYTKDGTGRS